jgi:hypothetical protein
MPPAPFAVLLARRPAPEHRRRDGYSIAAGGEHMHHPGGVTNAVIRPAQMNSW